MAVELSDFLFSLRTLVALLVHPKNVTQQKKFGRRGKRDFLDSLVSSSQDQPCPPLHPPESPLLAHRSMCNTTRVK